MFLVMFLLLALCFIVVYGVNKDIHDCVNSDSMSLMVNHDPVINMGNFYQM